MITCEIKVNGILIGVLYMRNTEAVGGPKNMKHIYKAEYYSPENGLKTVEVTHKRKDGALKIIKRAITAVEAVKQ